MTGQVRRCGAPHPETGTICELPLDHTENHRGEFSHGFAQWPHEETHRRELFELGKAHGAEVARLTEALEQATQERDRLQEVIDSNTTLSVRRIAELTRERNAARAERDQQAGEIAAAMAVLKPNMPESGLVDACKQVKQAAISAMDNSDVLERKCDQQAGALVTLRAALQTVMPFVCVQPIPCSGWKCREEWCPSCYGDEEAEAGVARAQAALKLADAALAASAPAPKPAVDGAGRPWREVDGETSSASFTGTETD
jgi:hypothetical protein